MFSTIQKPEWKWMWVPCYRQTLPAVWKSCVPVTPWSFQGRSPSGLHWYALCMLNSFQTVLTTLTFNRSKDAFFLHWATQPYGAVSRSPFCLTRLLFFSFWASLHTPPFFLFLEELDLLPEINETLAPSSTQNLLADKLEMESGLGNGEKVYRGREGGFHLGQVQTWT